MSIYVHMNNGVPFSFDPEKIPKLEENERLMHLIKIAMAFEENGVESVRVEWHKGEDDRFFVGLLAIPGSLGERLLTYFVEEAIKTNRMPTVDRALIIAKKVREIEAQSL